ncbi:MAG TPA: RsmD family RNA methyltransferase, partial [Burkholderiaceae bacterium]|nr:RsmD family RNA methyltransferase [Burkholderiaceae bacterium]
FEAASRGAARVVMIDREPRALASMRRLRDRLGATAVELVQADAIEWLRAAGDRRGGFDVVFLDPPFGRDWLRRALPLVVPLLAPGARVYVEAEAALHALLESLPEGLTLARAQRAGQVHYHLLQYELSPREPDSWQLPSTPARSTR